MIFRCQGIEQQLEWNDSIHINELVIENPIFLRRILKFFSLSNEDNTICIYENDKTYDIDKDLDIIFNPTHLDFNNRKAITTLLKLLVKTSLSEEFYLSTGKLKTKIIKYLDEIVNDGNFCFEVSTEDFTIDSIAKAVNIHIVGDEDNFVELLTDYMSMMAELVNTKLFIFINLRSLLPDDELDNLTHELNNHQINVLLVENFDHGKRENMKRIVIDKDDCEI